jgi:hypothetical protein
MFFRRLIDFRSGAVQDLLVVLAVWVARRGLCLIVATLVVVPLNAVPRGKSTTRSKKLTMGTEVAIEVGAEIGTEAGTRIGIGTAGSEVSCLDQLLYHTVEPSRSIQ